VPYTDLIEVVNNRRADSDVYLASYTYALIYNLVQADSNFLSSVYKDAFRGAILPRIFKGGITFEFVEEIGPYHAPYNLQTDKLYMKKSDYYSYPGFISLYNQVSQQIIVHELVHELQDYRMDNSPLSILEAEAYTVQSEFSLRNKKFIVDNKNIVGTFRLSGVLGSFSKKDFDFPPLTVLSDGADQIYRYFESKVLIRYALMNLRANRNDLNRLSIVAGNNNYIDIDKLSYEQADKLLTSRDSVLGDAAVAI